jgi:hypothetical protein
VILLSQPRRRPLLTAYLAGGLTISIGLGLVIIVALQQSKAVASSSSATSWVTDIVVGGLALLLAVALATRTDERFRQRRRARHPEKQPDPDAQDSEPWTQRLLARGSVPIVFFAGLAVNLPGAAYLVALKDIAAAHDPTAKVVALVVAFNLIMFTLAEVPLAGLVLAPDRTVALVDEANAWLAANGRQIVVVLSAALGVFLLVRGLAKA